MAAPISIPVTANANPLYDEIIRQARRAEAAVKKIPLRIETKDLGGFKTLTADIDRFDKSVSRMSAVITTFGQAAAIIFGIQNAFAAMVKTSIKVEKQLNDINAIFGASGKTMKQFSDGLFDVAKQTGQSFDVAATAAQEFARQGLGVEQTLKRTRDALTLTRISGLDAASATESLTAILNTFKKEALDSTRVTNILANVDTKFAVSAADLTEALKRAGASAADAKVPFNELVAAVTSLQQSTARGGSVIGNSLKSIFTRVQRGDTIDALRAIGVEVRDANGKTKPMLATLQQLADKFSGLSDATRASVKEQVAGVYQINQLSALLADLSSGYSIYSKALAVANGTQNEATDRLEVLKNVTAGSLNDMMANLTKFAAESGKIVINPVIKKSTDILNSLFDNSDGVSESEAFGKTVGEGVLKGIGSLLTSGGGIVIGKALYNISRLVAVGVKDQIVAATTLNRSSEKKLFLQEQVKSVMLSTNSLHQAAIKSASSEADKRRIILEILRQQEAALLNINSLSSKFASQFLKEGISSFSGAAPAKKGLFRRAADGFIPSMIAEKQAVNKGVGGAPKSARPVVIPNFNMGGGKKETIVANSSEYIVPNYANGGSAIFNQDMVKRMGKPRGARKIMAGGYIPNFAEFGKYDDYADQLKTFFSSTFKGKEFPKVNIEDFKKSSRFRKNFKGENGNSYRGFFDPTDKSIFIRKNQTDRNKYRTLIHEAGHAAEEYLSQSQKNNLNRALERDIEKRGKSVGETFLGSHAKSYNDAEYSESIAESANRIIGGDGAKGKDSLMYRYMRRFISKRFANGHIPNLAKLRFGKSPNDMNKEGVRRLSLGENDSYLDYRSTQVNGEKALAIEFLKSRKRGEGFEMFNKLVKLSRKAKINQIYSTELIPQGSREELKTLVSSNSAVSALFKAFPQLKYRDQKKLGVSGSITGLGSPLKFRGLNDLRRIASNPKNEGPFKYAIANKTLGLFDLKTKIKAGGYIPNFNPLLASAQREAASLSELGYSREQIFQSLKVQSSPRLKNKGNPNGLGLFNTLQGQNTIGQALSDHKGENLHKSGIPNFASPQEALSDIARRLNSRRGQSAQFFSGGAQSVIDLSKDAKLFKNTINGLVTATKEQINEISKQINAGNLDKKATEKLTRKKQYLSETLEQSLKIAEKDESLVRRPLIQNALLERNKSESLLKKKGVANRINSLGETITFDPEAQTRATRRNSADKALRKRQADKDKKEQDIFDKTVSQRRVKREAEEQRKKEYTARKVSEASRRNESRDLLKKRQLTKDQKAIEIVERRNKARDLNKQRDERRLSEGLITEDQAVSRGTLSAKKAKMIKNDRANQLRERLEAEQYQKQQERQSRNTNRLLALSFAAPIATEGALSVFGSGNEKDPTDRFISGGANSISTGLALGTLGPIGIGAGVAYGVGGLASSYVKSREAFTGQRSTTQDLEKTIDSNQRQRQLRAEFGEGLDSYFNSTGFEKTMAQDKLRKVASQFEDTSLGNRAVADAFSPTKSIDDIFKSQQEIFGKDESIRDAKENKDAAREFFAQVVDGTGFFARFNNQIEFAPQKVSKFVDLLSNSVQTQDLRGKKVDESFVGKVLRDSGLELGQFKGNPAVDSLAKFLEINLKRKQSADAFGLAQQELNKQSGTIRTQTIEKGRSLFERAGLAGELNRRSLFEKVSTRLESPIFSEEAKTQVSFDLKQKEVTSKLIDSMKELSSNVLDLAKTDSGMTTDKASLITRSLSEGLVSQDPMSMLKAMEDLKALTKDGKGLTGDSISKQDEILEAAKRLVDTSESELDLIKDLKNIQSKNAKDKALLDYFNKSGLKGGDNLGRNAANKSLGAVSAETVLKEAQRLSSDNPQKTQRVNQARTKLAEARIAKFENDKARGLGPTDDAGRLSAVNKLTPEVKAVTQEKLLSDLSGAVSSLESSSIGKSIEISTSALRKVIESGDITKLPSELGRFKKNSQTSIRQGNIDLDKSKPILDSLTVVIDQLIEKLNPSNLDALAQTETQRLVGGVTGTDSNLKSLSNILNPTTSSLLASTLSFDKTAKELAEALKQYKLETEKISQEEKDRQTKSDQLTTDKTKSDKNLDLKQLVEKFNLAQNDYSTRVPSLLGTELASGISRDPMSLASNDFASRVATQIDSIRAEKAIQYSKDGNAAFAGENPELAKSIDSLKPILEKQLLTFEQFYNLSAQGRSNILNAPSNFDPYAAAIRRAKNKEMRAGIPYNEIYTDTDKRLISPTNPMGMMVANYLDEPNGGFEGVDRKIKRGLNPRLSESGVPNFANNETYEEERDRIFREFRARKNNPGVYNADGSKFQTNASLGPFDKYFKPQNTEQAQIFKNLKAKQESAFKRNGATNFTNATPKAIQNTVSVASEMAALQSLVAEISNVAVNVKNESQRVLRLDINGTSTSVKDLQEMETRILDKCVAIIDKNRKAMGERGLVLT